MQMQPASTLSAQRVMQMWRAVLGSNGKPLPLRKFVQELNAVSGARPITYQAAGLWNVGRGYPLPERAQNNYLLAAEGSWQRSFWRDMMQAIEARPTARRGRKPRQSEQA